MKTRTYRSARHAAAIGVIRALVIFAAIVVGYAATTLMDTTPSIVYPDGSSEAAPAAPADAIAETITEHGCWTGAVPAEFAGSIPGHVVTQHGYQGAKAVGQAFGQLFDGEAHGLTVYAFCP